MYSLCICMYACILEYMYVCTGCVCVGMFHSMYRLYIYMCVCTYVCMYVSVCIYVCICVYV